MWQHNLKITFRKFQRNKTAFGINLIGLSTGLACTLLIFMWVQDELSVDKFNEKDSQLYEVAINAEMPRGIHTYRIELQSWYFILPGLLVLLVAWATVGLQTMQALYLSSFQPVKVLKGTFKFYPNGLISPTDFHVII